MNVSVLYGADNEIYIDQSGATFNLDVEQLGSGNIIGGVDAAAGSMTALDLDGGTQTIDTGVDNTTKSLIWVKDKDVSNKKSI